VIGLEIEVKGLNGGIGDAVLLGPPGRRIRAEVVAVSGNANILMPLGSASGLSPNDPAELIGGRMKLPVSDGYRGRVINAFGEPIDDFGPVLGPV
jgi:flagellar biosynthesis/type III secretory pathway ATPase